MTVDWRLSRLQREAQAKREQLAHLNATIRGLDTMLEEARAFEGYFHDKVRAVERRIGAVAQLWAADGPYVVQRGDPVEYDRLVQEQQLIERERDEERARRTTTGTDGLRTLYFCALSPADVIGKRGRVIIARDEVARELATIEAQMTPGQMVESGIPAPEYVDHRERVAALRERIGGAS